MADEMTPGEISRRFDRIERDQRATDDRITGLAKAMVPTELWGSEHRALADDVKHLETDTSAAFARVDKTSLERRAALVARDDDLAKAIEALRAEFKAEVKAVRTELEQKAAKRTEWSRQLKITVFTVVGAVVAALLGAWVTALLTAKGIR